MAHACARVCVHTTDSEPLPVVLFVHQVIAGTEGYQMGIVGWCWDRN